MAFVTKSSDESRMADEELPGDIVPQRSNRPESEKPTSVSYASKISSNATGYFTLYKKGQGYWTRLATVSGAILIGAFTAYNLYQYVPTFIPARHDVAVKIAAGIALGFIIGFAWLCWQLLNKPSNVDFLIATDSEMKKVNWTSRKELVGSTKIVIVFMFLVAFFLFAVDTEFSQAFYYLRVINIPPISYSVNVENLGPGDVAVSDITPPGTREGATPVVLSPAHQPIGAALPAIKSSGLKSVSVVPSSTKWIIWHVAILAVLSLAVFLRVREKEAPARLRR